MTIGEDRVRVKFNPGADTTVDVIKKKSAELIDLVETLRQDPVKYPSNHTLQCIEFAQKAYEEAAMWAVKAATA